MEEKRERAQPTLSTLAAASAAAISLVLGDDNLLGEILLRLVFPTDLVRAAAVCRRWLRAASDPVFLRRFRDLHPPRLLGFYIDSYPTLQRRFRSEFVPMQPQPPELAAVLRRGRFSLDTYDSQSTRVLECHNGRVIVSLFCGGDFKRGVHSPLHPTRDLVVFPKLPTMDVPALDNFGKIRVFSEILCKESVDGLEYLSVSLDYCDKEEKATACVYGLQDNSWRMQTEATTQIPELSAFLLKQLSIFLAEDKIYMGITTHNILVLDLTSSTFSTINYPDDIKYPDDNMLLDGQIVLSQANGSGVCLAHLKDLQLCIWLHRDCKGSIGDWFLVDSVPLHDLCANLKISNSTTEDGDDLDDAYIHMVGDDAEYVFLEMNGCVLYLDVRSRALQKVYSMTEKDTLISFIHPFMMTWPPVFPALRE